MYLDDTIIFSKSFEEHLVHLAEVLDRIIAAGLKPRGEKCEFGADSVHYLWYIITPNGVSPDPDKVSAILSIPFPRTPREMSRFLGAVSRQFLSHVYSGL